MGRVDGRFKDHRSDSQKTDDRSAARNPLGKICARIYSRNENRPTALREAAAESRKTSDRKSRHASPRTNELEKRRQKAVGRAAALGSAPFPREIIFPD